MRHVVMLSAMLTGSALAGCATPMSKPHAATPAKTQACAALLNAGRWSDRTLRIRLPKPGRPTRSPMSVKVPRPRN